MENIIITFAMNLANIVTRTFVKIIFQLK